VASLIVAHSQCAVITADLLRFLYFQFKNGDKDPTLRPLFTAELPIYLMTFGSPLRQLYDLRFPSIYAWTYRPHNGENEGPDPSELGLRAWFNGYRSGDYVGRYLWHSDNDSKALIPGNRIDIQTAKTELCLGEGAHTHYFDETAPSVPNWLNHVISEVIANKTATPVQLNRTDNDPRPAADASALFP
jgi:hypothetical protein